MADHQLFSRLMKSFGHSPLVANGVFAFALALVEKIAEVEFACPCNPQWNRLFASAFFVIPAIIVFLLMMIIHECKRSNPQKSIFSFVPPLVWQGLIFLDGQYFVCAQTYWSGTFVSVDNSYLKWCTPTNTTIYSSEELMAYSHRMFVVSQAIGFIMLICFSVAILAYGIMKSRKKEAPQQSTG